MQQAQCLLNEDFVPFATEHERTTAPGCAAPGAVVQRFGASELWTYPIFTDDMPARRRNAISVRHGAKTVRSTRTTAMIALYRKQNKNGRWPPIWRRMHCKKVQGWYQYYEVQGP